MTLTHTHTPSCAHTLHTAVRSGRAASLVVLQRRWHELKLQARERLAAYWRPPAPPSHEAAPPSHEVAPPSPGAAPPSPGVAPPAPPSAEDAPPAPPPPRPAPLHVAVLRRYPHVATRPLRCWRELVLDGIIVTEPLVSQYSLFYLFK